MKTALIVPAYKPTKDMIPMLEQFIRHTDITPIVVNDGSGESFESLFARIPEGCILLNHEINKGKGAALKTAMGYILHHRKDFELAVTADADGQHRFEDIMRVVEISKKNPNALVLGSRAFDGSIPLRSRFGNSVTRQVFALASGVTVRDTQTGLRAFGRDVMQQFITIGGEHYEYEINMLLYAAQNKIPIIEETIQTIYIDSNASSHFNPLHDSLKIYMCIFRYIGSSLSSFAVDFFALFFFRWLTAGLGEELSLLLSVVLARIVSSIMNFTVNKLVVFHSREKWLPEFLKYAILALSVLIANYFMIRFLNIVLDWPLFIAKILVECTLFVIGFFIQGKIVYKRK
ncbi:MAG: GtrA family protein [Christensenellales bacterium]|nr:GtrA family protein [Christensenellales bacterium]